MKKIKYILINCLALLILFSCNKEDDNFDYLDSLAAPANVSASFQITQDNTGLVTITPNAEGAVSYNITYGDGTAESVVVKQGANTQHVYAEGSYTVKIEATGITGLKSEVEKELMVSFRAPENLEINAEIDSSNPFVLNVSATADYATYFLVYFDTSNPDEEPTHLDSGASVSFQYPVVGDYTIKVVALSGGVATTEKTEVITIAKPTELPIDFEIFDSSVFIGFGGASAAVVDNPDTKGNTSAKVGKIVKGGPETWAGNVITTSAPIDFSTKKFIKMKVWSPRAGGKMILKLENLTDGNINKEVEVTTVGNGAWEEVVFDFSTIDVSKTYQKLVMFFDIGTIGTGGANWTFYIDDIKQVASASGAFSKLTVEDFNGTAPAGGAFGNAGYGVVTLNDLPSGLGVVTNGVGKFDKALGAETWAGLFFSTTTLDLDTYSKISIKTWSPKSGAVVKLKIENADASITHEVDMNTTVTNAWEEIVYDFSGAPAANYVKIVLFFDFNVAGDGSVYYFDDVQLRNTGTSPTLFEGYEGVLPQGGAFGNADYGVVTLDDLPSGLGNVTAHVGKFDKKVGAETWAGLFFSTTTLDLDTYNKISIKTWSPKAGVVVKLKLENADASITHEVDMNTTVANSWEEIVYDFSAAPAANYVKVVLFFDFNVAGDGSVYYFDDLTLTD
ncbi:hypothetical protein ACGK9U_01935 [Mariniflexile sp. HNIBRBA6329]|uniref:hypothetical protein n=1 Tax=Mariniflexile sp. HNIBRBA6329 TaxID=3373088 RepID=UPI0037475F02